MGTLADAMTDATAAENRAVDALNDAAALLRSRAATAQAAINDFVTRPAAQYLHVDPVNGSDANDGLSYAKAFKTLDYMYATRDQNRFTTVYLFGDGVISKLAGTFAPIDIIGVSAVRTADGGAWVGAKRQITWAAEAANSPAPGIGRTFPTLIAQCEYLRYANIDLRLPMVDPALNYRDAILAYGTSIVLLNSTLSVADNASTVALIGAGDGQPLTLTATSFTLGSNAAGHLLRGIAAGGNPNGDFRYKSNLTAA